MIRSALLCISLLITSAYLYPVDPTPGSVAAFEGSDYSLNMLLNKHHYVVIDWFATWCGPCKAFAPMYQALAQEFAVKGVIFIKIDVDKSRNLAQRYGIQSMPTFSLFRNGGLVTTHVGADKNGLRNKIITLVG